VSTSEWTYFNRIGDKEYLGIGVKHEPPVESEDWYECVKEGTYRIRILDDLKAHNAKGYKIIRGCIVLSDPEIDKCRIHEEYNLSPSCSGERLVLGALQYYGIYPKLKTESESHFANHNINEPLDDLAKEGIKNDELDRIREDIRVLTEKEKEDKWVNDLIIAWAADDMVDFSSVNSNMYLSNNNVQIRKIMNRVKEEITRKDREFVPEYIPEAFNQLKLYVNKGEKKLSSKRNTGADAYRLVSNYMKKMKRSYPALFNKEERHEKIGD